MLPPLPPMEGHAADIATARRCTCRSGQQRYQAHHVQRESTALPVSRLVNDLFIALAKGQVIHVRAMKVPEPTDAPETDSELALLVDTDHQPRLFRIIGDLGFVTMLPPDTPTMAALHSFLGFDPPTGALVHVDVQFGVANLVPPSSNRHWFPHRAKPVGSGEPRWHLGRSAPFVAIVGADGSGKTTLTRDLEVWLGRKLVVHHIYFGQPKSDMFFKLLNKPGQMARKRLERRSLSPLFDGFVRYSDAAKWVVLAHKRGRLARRARHDSRRGEVVIAERFPLEEFREMETPMDGPRLQPAGPFARAEMRPYRTIEPPDLTIVLDARMETLRNRKSDITLAEHAAKVAAVQGLQARPDRIVIDATRPYDEVLLTAKTALWETVLAGG